MRNRGAILWMAVLAVLLCSFKPLDSHLRSITHTLSKLYPGKTVTLKGQDSERGIYQLMVNDRNEATIYFRELTPRSETFSYAVAIGNDGEIIKMQILDYPSPYGTQITRPAWAAKFSGKTPGELVLGRNVDAVTGATLTVNSLINDLKSIEQ